MTVHASEFSEFGFGFAVTEQLAHCRIGTISPFPSCLHKWPYFLCPGSLKNLLTEEFELSSEQARAVISATAPPFFPTQRMEKHFPVDMAMNCKGIFYFLQFKRSKCVSIVDGRIKEKNEVYAGKLSTPLFRVEFSGTNGDRNQRQNLEKLEKQLASLNVAIVRYAAPAFYTLSQLSGFYNQGFLKKINGRWPVLCFKASAFTLPDTKSHCVSFDGKSNIGWRYSSEAKEVPGISPLVSEIEKCASDAPFLSQSMTLLCKHLDQLADDMGLEPRSEKLKDREFLSIFGLKVPAEERPEPPSSMQFLVDSPEFDAEQREAEADLASAIKKIMEYSLDNKTENIMIFLKDFYGADYRCRQILGQPLIIGLFN